MFLKDSIECIKQIEYSEILKYYGGLFHSIVLRDNKKWIFSYMQMYPTQVDAIECDTCVHLLF